MLENATTDAARVERAIERGGLIASVDEHDVMVGFALLDHEGDDVHLEELAVDPAFGRRGRGTALLLATIGLATGARARRVTLVTLDFVPFGRTYYERRGFSVLAPHELSTSLRELAPPDARDGRIAMAHAITAPG